MNDVLITRQADRTTAWLAERAGLKMVVLGEGQDTLGAGVAFDRALIAEPGVAIPWDLVGYGLHFIERWDAAAPLWRYGVLAEHVGTPADRARTKAVTRDLRMLVYAHELLFVRNSSGGMALLQAWQEERAQGGEPRLAFLRALYRAKPMFCALPRSWLMEAPLRQARDRTARRAETHRRRVAVRAAKSPAARQPAASRRPEPQSGPAGSVTALPADPARTAGPAPQGPSRQAPATLVRVEIGPGRYVKCRAEDAERVRERYARRGRHPERRKGAEHADH